MKVRKKKIEKNNLIQVQRMKLKVERTALCDYAVNDLGPRS
jgi:hypothetical protein